MVSLEFLLVIAFGGAFLTYLLGKISSGLRDFFVVLISCGLVVITACLYGKSLEKTFSLGFFGLPFILRINMLSWLFAVTISVFSALSIIFSLSYMKGRGRLDFYYLMILLVNAGMLGIVLSGDFVTFYIFWEIMSWATFLLISSNRGPALAAGIKYVIMSIIGSVAMLVGVLSVYSSFNTFDISKVASSIAFASSGYVLFVLIIFGIAFGIKNAVWPLHTWLPDSYTESSSSFTAVLSGMLTRMGIYGFLLIMYVIVGFKNVITPRVFNYNIILCWLGAITIIISSLIALLQDDAKKLLAWSSIGQGGYMILGIAFGTSLGFVGGVYHTIIYSACVVLLFMAVGAVEYRTGGMRDLNELGGLIKKMPIAFFGALVGICGLIGIPLTGPFVSKWLIYKTLILEGHPLLAFIALIGTWISILYSYKFLHNMFLGQLPEKYKKIKRSPFSMQLPMIILSTAIILFGIVSGIPLKIINNISTAFGFEKLNVTILGIASETGMLNTINIFAAILVSCIVVWLIFRLGKKPTTVPQEDNYAAGAYIPEGKYHYTAEFYNPLFRMIKPCLTDVVDKFYLILARGTQRLSDRIRRMYVGDVGYYAIYIVLFLALLIFIQLRWKPW